MKTIGVSLLGLGNVGGGVVKLLAENAAAIEARLGARLEVRAIAVRDPDKVDRVVRVDREKLSTSLDDAIARPDVDIVVRDLAPDKASATVKFSNIKMPTTVVYDLVKLKDGWRIADITWDGNDTLRGVFEKK